MNAATLPAFLHGLKLSGLTMFADVQLVTYDVWGNARDGWEVNDAHTRGTYRLSCDVTVCNIPAPMSAGGRSSFPAPNALVSVELRDRDVLKLFGPGCAIGDDSDELTVYVNNARNGKPIGEVRVVGWADSVDGAAIPVSR